MSYFLIFFFLFSYDLFSYLVSISHGGSINPSIPTFLNVNLTKTMKILLVVLKVTKDGCNNLYFHPYTVGMSYKSFSYLTPLSRHDPVNESTSIFRNINLTEAIANLLFAWKFNQK